jgi:hypothetical protein
MTHVPPLAAINTPLANAVATLVLFALGAAFVRLHRLPIVEHGADYWQLRNQCIGQCGGASNWL